MKFQRKLLACILLLNLVVFSKKAMPENTGEIHANENSKGDRLAELLVQPECLKSFDRTVQSCEIIEVRVPSDNILLDGKLYLPKDSGRYPAVVFMHGGGNDAEELMSGPRFYARRLAHCGIAALIYDKRGTGKSGGVFHEASLDDFINDAGSAIRFLIARPEIDAAQIGIYGGSEGGCLAPVAAVRFPEISFVISTSGPIGRIVDQANHNISYALRLRGFPDSVVDEVMPLWRRHHASWASQDSLEKMAVAEEIAKYRKIFDTLVLPSPENEILADTNLFFLRPQFNSMSKDYYNELSRLSVPLLALYGALDPIINVEESARNLEIKMREAGNKYYEIYIIDSVSHSFNNPTTGEFLPTEFIIINWLYEKMNLGQ